MVDTVCHQERRAQVVHWASFTAVGLELDLVHVPCSTQPVERVKVGIDVVAPGIPKSQRNVRTSE